MDQCNQCRDETGKMHVAQAPPPVFSSQGGKNNPSYQAHFQLSSLPTQKSTYQNKEGREQDKEILRLNDVPLTSVHRVNHNRLDSISNHMFNPGVNHSNLPSQPHVQQVLHPNKLLDMMATPQVAKWKKVAMEWLLKSGSGPFQ